MQDRADYQLPVRQRGNYNSKFKTKQILCNYFHVTLLPIEYIYIYNLKFTPYLPLENTKQRMQLLNKAYYYIGQVIQNPIISGSNIFSHHGSQKDQFSVEVQKFQIRIKMVKVIKTKDNPGAMLNFINIAFKNMMKKLNFTQLGKQRKFFNTIKFQEPDQEIRLFSGYQANFLLAQSGNYLRINPAKKIVRKERVLDAINSIYRQHSSKERQQKRTLIKECLIGKTVMTNYGKPRYFRIDDILFQNIDSQCITGTQITLRQFYKEKYNIMVQNTNQPLLVVKNKKKPQPDLMIPQLCLMTGLPDTFDEYRRKKISASTIKSAEQKKEQIDSLINSVFKDQKQIQYLNKLGISISPKMQKVKSISIPPPVIQLGEDETIQKGKQAEFQLFAQPIYASKHSIRLGIIYTARARIQDVLQTFKNTSTKLKVKLDIRQYNLGQTKKVLDAILLNIQIACNDNCNIIFIIIPNYLKAQYKKIKEHCLLSYKTICQVACQGTLQKKNVQSIATKILLQIIAKKGNTLWVPSFPQQASNLMLIGFDTASIGGNSVVSICATVNSTFSSIYTLSQKYQSIQQKMQKMSILLCQVIEYYCQRNKKMPSDVIIFHNACSDDQIKLYVQYFLQPTKYKLADNSPSFILVMVNVKTNERFFNFNQNGQIRNVNAGTLVATDIISPNYDFFMVSQFSSKGSTVPNHYKVIYSNSKLEQGVVQTIVFSQCFNYVNWTGSIKIPGILQYAKKSSKFNSQILQGKKLDKQIRTKLYFV